MICPQCQSDNDDSVTACFNCGRPLMSLASIRKGTVVAGRYEVLGALGKGGMGMVFKAHDRVLDETVALKVLRSEVAGDDDMARRFRQEIKLARKVRHRHVCGIHEYGEADGLRYIAMEYIEGVDLRQVLHRQGAPLPAEAFEISIQLCEGLQAIHDAGVIHRDLKTPNIMRDAKGHVRLMDFGIAKQYGEATMGATALGMIIGTPEYMSPEQARGEKIDFRSDVYALGIVIFEIFTGHVPFKGDTPLATIFKHLQDVPPLYGPDGPVVLEPLIPVLQKALAKAPGDRYETVDEMGEALRDARRHAFGAEADKPMRGSGSFRTGGAGAAPAPAMTPHPFVTPSATPRPTPIPTHVPTHVPTAAVPAVVEKEREAREQAERERAERERAARERADHERAEQDRAEAERQRSERERAERERADRERADRERVDRERVDRERVERERAAREAAEREKQAALHRASADVRGLIARNDFDGAARTLAATRQAHGAEPALAELERALEQARQQAQNTYLQSLIADGERHLAAGRPAEAAAAARQVLAVEPGHGAARQLAARADAAARQRQEEEQRARQLQAATAAVDAQVARGDLTGAAEALARLEQTYGRAEALVALRERLGRARQAALAEVLGRVDGLMRAGRLDEAATALADAQRLAPGDGEIARRQGQIEDERRRRAEAAVVAQVEALIARSDWAAADRELQKVESSFGKSSRVRELRRDLKERQKAAGKAEAQAQRATRAAAAEEETVVLRAEGVAVQEPGPRLPLKLVAAAGVAAAIVAGVVIWRLTRTTPEAAPVPAPSAEVAASPAPSAAPLPPGTGMLIVDAAPWGEVVEVLDGQGRRQPIADPYTPVALALPPGDYSISVRNPNFGRAVSLRAKVEGGGLETVRAEFTRVDVADYFRKTGW